jgi:hypothetical protein
VENQETVYGFDGTKLKTSNIIFLFSKVSNKVINQNVLEKRIGCRK